MNTQYQAYQRQYEDTLLHLYDLSKPFIIDGLNIDTDIVGQTKVFKRIGTMTAQKKTGRNEIATLDEPDFSARHLTTDTYYCATPLDMEDVEKMVQNPKDDLYQEVVHAIYDAQTDVAMTGFFADVIINEDGGSTSSFPAANQIAVNFSTGAFGLNSGAADVGLNIDKLWAIRSKLAAAKVRFNTTEMNSLHIAVTEDDVQDLISTKVGSDQYPLIDRFNSLHAELGSARENMVDGMFQFQGFTFHLVPPAFFKLDASGHRRLPVWTKDGMTFGIKKNVETEILRLPSTVESVKIQALTRVGALRKHDSKVYEIKAKV